jgi:hypothetical protein
MGTRILKAYIQSLRKSGKTSALIETHSPLYAPMKDNTMPFPMTYYTIIFGIVTYSRSSNVTFEPELLKMWYSF